MARLLTSLALAGALVAPGPGAGDELYSFVDGDGVTHYTNVPHEPRYHLVPGDGGHAPRPDETRRPGAGRVAPPLPRRTAVFDQHIRAASRKYGLAPPLLKAVMAVESNFDPTAISSKGAAGLMQLMPETARDMCVRDLLDPAQNIEGGARYLRQLQDRFGGDLERVLAAYNAG
ncbi:MAG TPA: lytic transglycosylase domain-containing protein, partial [Streptosporangiaceae bacterium]